MKGDCFMEKKIVFAMKLILSVLPICMPIYFIYLLWNSEFMISQKFINIGVCGCIASLLGICFNVYYFIRSEKRNIQNNQ